MSRSRTGNIKLPKCNFIHELFFLNSPGEPQESHSNFININETSPISESNSRDLNFKVTPKLKRKQDDQSTYKTFPRRHA